MNVNEMCEIIEALSNSKSPGYDGIASEHM